MAYSPEWEPLADALKRVTATSANEDAAKIALCRALADGKIQFRVRIAASDLTRGRQVFSGHNVGMPSHLDPSDFDWVRSRPLNQWPIGPVGPQNYTWISGWRDRTLDLIELLTSDMARVLCGAETEGANARQTSESSTMVRQSPRPKQRPALDRAKGIVDEIFPDGIPGQADMPNKELCAAVADALKAKGKPAVSNDTMLRAAGRRK